MTGKNKGKEVYRVQEYTRYNKFGEPYKVKSHKRKKRDKGGKVSYDRVGSFYVAHDEYGNFRGSRVQPYKKSVKKQQKQREGLSEANRAFLKEDISYDELIKKKKDKLDLI